MSKKVFFSLFIYFIIISCETNIVKEQKKNRNTYYTEYINFHTQYDYLLSKINESDTVVPFLADLEVAYKESLKENLKECSSDTIIKYLRLDYIFVKEPKAYKPILKNVNHSTMKDDLQLKFDEINKKRALKENLKGLLNIRLKDENENIKTINQINSKYIFIDIWASWSVHSRVFNRELAKNGINDIKKLNTAFVSISLDESSEKWINAIQQDGLKSKHLIDKKGYGGEICKYLNIETVPFNLLITNKGEVIDNDLHTKNEIISSIIGHKKRSHKKGVQ
jgi:hypothetical protein